MYITRAIEQAVSRTSRTFPVLLVTGPRQVGKTTLLRRLAEDGREYVTLDDPDVRALAAGDPALFMQRYKPPVLIDEIQYAPGLLPYIKMSADESAHMGDFWLTGSQAFHLMKGVSESLAGRVGIITLLGLSSAEIDGRMSEPFTTDPARLGKHIRTIAPRTLEETYRRIFRGSMPRLYAQPETDWETYYRSYVETYLQRDISDLAQVGDTMAFYNFMTAVAANTARPCVYSELAAAAGVSPPTAKKWLSVLLSSHLVALVRPFSNNLLKRVVKTPLLHFLDTGLAAHLLRWGNPEALERGAMSGAFFESWVFSEIYKSYVNAGRTPPIYYYRDKDKREIDLLLYENGRISPIEVKKAASPAKAAVKHFSVLSPLNSTDGLSALKTEIGTGSVICMSEKLLPIDEKNWLVPSWLI